MTVNNKLVIFIASNWMPLRSEGLWTLFKVPERIQMDQLDLRLPIFGEGLLINCFQSPILQNIWHNWHVSYAQCDDLCGAKFSCVSKQFCCFFRGAVWLVHTNPIKYFYFSSCSFLGNGTRHQYLMIIYFCFVFQSTCKMNLDEFFIPKCFRLLK